MDFHDQLDVFLNENKIGTLFTDNGVMSFAYDTEFLNTPGAYPLSKNLPLKEGFFTDSEVEGFFSNLLPDERIRNTVAMILHVSPGNTFRLLKEIGADCAGAVSFYPQGETPQSANDPVYRELSAEEAYKNGSAAICLTLGNVFRDGKICPKDIRRAETYYKEGVKRGNPDCKKALSNLK